ncbi:hypothetical protein E3J62_03125 [candidate division TA06 bacterium]|uniref:Uncharacterized protein n=1 Tax=candidate division TA06 bacterium TaxID=2250710 RepID=A0A523UWA8_UNCT6|nr:MAG: hypothetical protein E3J62_03125 [candidate division TA06 bacterium]
MSEFVFILGAGASKEAGAPLMADFLDRAEELRRMKDVDELEPDFDRVFDAISGLMSVHSKSELDIYNIESVFAAFEMGKLVRTLPGISESSIDTLLLSIRRVITKTLEKSVMYQFRDGRVHPDRSYHSFALRIKQLNDDGQRGRCSIITFNYDLALDYALHFEGLPPDYGLSETKEPGTTSLIKLHGSLNWAQCRKCRAIVPWDLKAFFRKYRFDSLEEGQFMRLSLGSKLHKSDLMHCMEKVEGEPAIVPPTWNKTEYHDSIQKVWRHAARQLSDAENVLVSGYSLSETDSFFRYLYALGSVGQARIKRFWVIDPDEETVRPRFERMIGSGIKARFKFYKEDFGWAVNHIFKELAATC